jgi:hypothetical protein
VDSAMPILDVSALPRTPHEKLRSRQAPGGVP